MTESELAEAADSRAALVVDRASCIFEVNQYRTDLRAAPGCHELAASWKHNRLSQDQERKGHKQSDQHLHLKRHAIWRWF